MTPQLQDKLLYFIRQPRTLMEIAAHMNMSYSATQAVVKRMRFDMLIKPSDKRKIDGLFYNTYEATTLRERDELESSKEAETTPSPSFLNDPIMSKLYSRVNI